jgi:HEAT repeat protein
MAAILAGGLLAGCGRGDRPPDPAALVAELKSGDSAKSGEARLQLLALGEPAVPALVELLASASPQERLLAATTLWGMGPRAGGASPALGAALSDPDAQVRVTSAMALENMGPAAREAVPALVRALRDRERPVRQAAVKALGAIGPAASAALPTLTREIARESWPEAEEAVRRIRGADSGGTSPEPAP